MTKRWLRFIHKTVACFGTLSEDGNWVAVYSGDLFGRSAPTGDMISVADIAWLTPVVPTKLIGLWNNYHELALKLSTPVPAEPLYFVKTPNSYLPHHGIIRSPEAGSGRIVYEGELGIVIGRQCRCVPASEANDFIFGYTCVNDVTAVDVLQRDASFPQWVRAKSFDTFGPFGPVVAQGIDWKALRVRTLLNHRERQNYACADMIHTPPQIVSFLSGEMTLEAGDVIACGTSLGALPMKAGSIVQIDIDSIGVLQNVYAGAADASPSAS